MPPDSVAWASRQCTAKLDCLGRKQRGHGKAGGCDCLKAHSLVSMAVRACCELGYPHVASLCGQDFSHTVADFQSGNPKKEIGRSYRAFFWPRHQSRATSLLPHSVYQTSKRPTSEERWNRLQLLVGKWQNSGWAYRIENNVWAMKLKLLDSLRFQDTVTGNP